MGYTAPPTGNTSYDSILIATPWGTSMKPTGRICKRKESPAMINVIILAAVVAVVIYAVRCIRREFKRK